METQVYKVRDPSGAMREISGPVGATDEQVIAKAQELFGGSTQNAQPAEPKLQMSWADVPKQAVMNLPKSIGGVLSNFAEAVTSPVQTLSGAADVAAGTLRNITPAPIANLINRFENNPQAQQRAVNAANAAGGMLRERYGSAEALKNTLATDPAGVASDVGGVLSGGGALASRVPGLAAAGQTASRVGAAIDPLVLALRGTQAAGKVVAPVLGFTTGAGSTAINEAFQAGRQGGERGAAFTSQMRGTAPVNEVIETVKPAIERMRAERASQYRQGMGNVTKDVTVLDFNPIETAVADTKKLGTFKGKVIDESAADTWQKINDKVSEWRNSNPAEFHTAEGLDALKRSIGDIVDSSAPGTPSHAAAQKVYNEIKNQIVKQAPDYANVMKDYQLASDLLREVEKTLSMNPRANVDTQVRKLQSIMRNNANTNYGRRDELGRILESQGAENLYPQLAGQALSSPTPRSLQGIGSALVGAGQAVTNPIYGLGLALTSPRAVGEVTYATGRAAKLADQLRQQAPNSPISPTDAARLAQQLQRWQQQGAQQ
jgi:hypothetical protein